ncbi:MAG: hypothetical protein Q7J72_04720 [Candidatus Omnitrophota bacterium]|nr:hypothetical protein [Candidatus Omnitrophota bacterium]
MLRKITALILSVSLIITQPIFAQGLAQLNLAQYLGQARPVATGSFRPTQLRYFSYNNLNNSFRILLDKGDAKDIKDNQLKEQAKELMDYFLIGVTLPNDAFWVNLRPDSPDNIIDPELEQTGLGKILLEADLQLKKDTASFTSPQTSEGKAYWDKLYQKAGELFGTENITIPTLTRPWIVPGEIIVRESQDSAYIYKATLKVMLEEDYLEKSEIRNPKSETNSNSKIQNTKLYEFSRGAGSRSRINDMAGKDPRLKELNKYSTQLIRELIIPKLTQEVNSSQRYAKLRQVYYSLVLSRWFKMRFAGKSGQYASLINKRDLTNLTAKEPYNKLTYFKQYQESFAQGEYNLKEPVYTPYGQSIRSYMSGGFDGTKITIEGVNTPEIAGSSIVEKRFENGNTVSLEGSANILQINTNNALSEQPLAIVASPLGKELPVTDRYGRPLRYVYYRKLSDEGKNSLFEAFGKSFPEWGIKATDKNLRFAVRVNKANKIVAVVGALQYNIDTKVVGPIIIPKGVDKVLEIESSLRKAYSEEIAEGERLFRDKTISSSVGSPLDIKKAIDTFRNDFQASLKEFAELRIESNRKREVNEAIREYYTKVDEILKKIEEGINKNMDPLKVIRENIHSLNLVYWDFSAKREEMLNKKPGNLPTKNKLQLLIEKLMKSSKKSQKEISEAVPPPIFIFKVSLSRLLATFNSALYAVAPLATFKEKISEAVNKIEEEINDPGLRVYKEKLVLFLDNLKIDLGSSLGEIDKIVNAQGPLKDVHKAIEKVSTILFNRANEIGDIHTGIKSMMVRLLRDETPSLTIAIERSLKKREIASSPLTVAEIKSKAKEAIASAGEDLRPHILSDEAQNKYNLNAEYIDKLGDSPEAIKLWLWLENAIKFFNHRIKADNSSPEAISNADRIVSTYKGLIEELKQHTSATSQLIKEIYGTFKTRTTKSADDGEAILKALLAMGKEEKISKEGLDIVFEILTSRQVDRVIPVWKIIETLKQFSVGGIQNQETPSIQMAILNVLIDDNYPGCAFLRKERLAHFLRYAETLARSNYLDAETVSQIALAIQEKTYGKALDLVMNLNKEKMKQASSEEVDELKRRQANVDIDNSIPTLNRIIEAYINNKDSLLSAENKKIANNMYAVSSALAVKNLQQSQITDEIKRGGIDFTGRAMRIGLEPMGSFADLKLVLPEISNVAAIDLDNEFKQIQTMASSGIRPSDTRILEFAAACYYRGEFSPRLGEITDCLQQAHFLDERLGRESSPTLRLATMLPEVLYSSVLN